MVQVFKSDSNVTTGPEDCGGSSADNVYFVGMSTFIFGNIISPQHTY